MPNWMTPMRPRSHAMPRMPCKAGMGLLRVGFRADPPRRIRGFPTRKAAAPRLMGLFGWMTPVRGWLTAAMLALALSGCLQANAPRGPPAAEADAALRQLNLLCDAGPGGLRILESPAVAGCWGHMGHHTYFIDPPVLLHAVNGTLFAVELSA